MRRAIQLVTQVHEIHHVQWSYGFVIWFLPFGLFKSGLKRIRRRDYHNCTWSGVY